MSKYTTEVRYICESLAGLRESKGFNDVDEILNIATPQVFNFDFPIFDENYRFALEKKILRHYYTREIGMETYGAWKLKLQDKLCMIMPYYNELYKSATLEFNPFYDVDLTTDHSKETDGTSNTTSKNVRDNIDNTAGKYSDNTINHFNEEGASNSNDSGTSSTSDDGSESHTDTRSGTNSNTRWDLYSDTPQGGIQGIANAEDPSLANNGYLTNARKITDSGADSDTNTGSSSYSKDISNEHEREIANTASKEGTSVSTKNGTTNADRTQKITDDGKMTGVINNVESYLEHVKGKRGAVTYSKMLKEYRETFLNIDKLVIDELSDLFFGLWE